MLALAAGYDSNNIPLIEPGSDPPEPPLVEKVPPFGHLLVVPRQANWKPPTAEAIEQANVAGRELATDDWPFLYLKKPAIPTHYLFFMGLVILLGLLSFSLVEKEQRRLNLEFFFLGAGFLLLETRSVTEIALLFGSTWEVNALAFGAVLFAVLLANMVVGRTKALPIGPLYLGVLGMLVVGYLLPPGALYVDNILLRMALCGFVLYSPIFLAGLVFSTRFRGTANPNLLFGSNLLGAMTGGALEYGSLVLGLPPLYLVGALLYIFAFLSGRRP
jgi:hypothetical protein